MRRSDFFHLKYLHFCEIHEQTKKALDMASDKGKDKSREITQNSKNDAKFTVRLNILIL